MGPPTKSAIMAKDRRKSAKTNATSSARRSTSPGKPSLTVSLHVPSEKLRSIVDPAPPAKEETPVKDAIDSPATSTTLPAAPVSSGENASDSNPATPAAGGTPAPQPMGPPTEGPKKKGVKRASNANGEPKARGKPGPKKKQRLEDGTLEGGRASGLGAGHRLGPKANQGAINAGLRALDRSGKPCRKWAKGGFTLKSFTGTIWEVPRWTAPPKPKPVDITEESASASASAPASAAGSGKENKENGQVKSDNSNHDADVEMQSVPSAAAENSPASPAIAAA